jgi:hypothetical protein
MLVAIVRHLARGTIMPYQSCAPYRGFDIDIQATTGKSLCLHAPGRRYKVCWTISSVGQSGKTLASFPEQLEFLSENEAFRYAEDRAHTFIDGMLSAKSPIHSPSEVVPRPERATQPEA